jgi:hypothetical protein
MADVSGGLEQSKSEAHGATWTYSLLMATFLLLEHPNLHLSLEERRLFGQVFTAADSESLGVVTGDVALKFFPDKTKLPSEILGEVRQAGRFVHKAAKVLISGDRSGKSRIPKIRDSSRPPGLA